MEKKEARIKCNGCGTSYKIRIPVTDKPVSFKCKKCGKVLKLKIKATAPPPPPPQPEIDFRPPTNFETTQLPDDDAYQNTSVQTSSKRADFVEGPVFEQQSVPPPSGKNRERSWVVLDQDQINGPFSGTEIVGMIQAGEVTAQTQLRMGERPWVKAGEIAEFKKYFFEPLKNAGGTALETISLLDEEGEEHEDDLGGASEGMFCKQPSNIISYPLSQGKILPLVIFAGIAFVGCTALSFNMIIGFLLSIVLWILLYGYLADLMNQSKLSSENPPPDWDFKQITSMFSDGVRIFVVLLVYTIIPVTLSLLGATYFFLNNDTMFGYVFTILGLILFMGSLFTVPAALVIVDATRSIGTALNPGGVLGMITKGGQAYLMLAVISLLTGMVCLGTSFAGVMLLTDLVPDVGFVISGLLMAIFLSYAHFVWFHVLGRFSAENKKLLIQKRT